MVWKRKMYLVYGDMGVNGLSLRNSRLFKYKGKAEMYKDILNLHEDFAKLKITKYKIMEIEAIW